MDVTVRGAINVSSNNASGRITSFTATAPNGTPLVAYDGGDIVFTSLYGLSASLNMQSLLRSDDRINGSSSRDVLYGYWGDDYINGGAGDDVLYGGEGFDTIDGGDGNDAVITRQYYAPGQIIQYNGRTAILDRSNGSDFITNIEYITFNDKTVGISAATGFDAMGYLAANRDLAAAFGMNGDAAFNHYVQKGMYENRPMSFDAAGYLAANQDLAAAFGANTEAATRHYITSGRLENRNTTFNAMSYIAANPDLIQAFGTNTTAAALHYATFGRLENRPTSFNATAYLARYSDLRFAFGSRNEAAATTHYILSGFREGRSAAPLTSTTTRIAAAFMTDEPSPALAAAL